MAKTISSNPFVQKHYERCLREGTSEKLAELFATGQTPAIRTDATFLAGHANGSQFSGTEYLGDFYAGVARRHGQDPKGKVYLSSLAKFPGDPEAWVSGRGDVERVLTKRGWGAEGAVNVKLPDIERPEMVPLADDLAEAEVLDQLEAMPIQEAKRANLGEMKHAVVQKRKPSYAK